MAAMPAVGMGVGVVPVETGIATVTGAVVTGAVLKGEMATGVMERIKAVTGETVITGIAGVPQVVLRAVLRAVLPEERLGVFRKVVDPMNVRPGGGVLPPEEVGAVPVLSVQELLGQGVFVLDPVAGWLVARIGAGTESDGPMEEIVDPKQVASPLRVGMVTAAPARVVSAIAPIVSTTGCVVRSVLPTVVHPGMSVHRLGPASEHRQDARIVSSAPPLRRNPKLRLRLPQQMI